MTGLSSLARNQTQSKLISAGLRSQIVVVEPVLRESGTCVRIFGNNIMNNSMRPAGVCTRFKIHGGSCYTHQRISGSNGQYPIQDRSHLRKLPQELIPLSQALKDVIFRGSITARSRF